MNCVNLYTSMHLESKFLGLIGLAEMEGEIQRAVKTITKESSKLENEIHQPLELDEKELKDYIDFVIREVKKDGQGPRA